MKLPEEWDLQIDPSVFKILRRISRDYAEAVLGVIKVLPIDPYFGDIRKMKGEENTWRKRVGAYKIFYRIKVAERIILVFRLERRTSKTY